MATLTGPSHHFHNRPENFLEIGWRAADAALEHGFTGSEKVPEPSTLVLLALTSAGVFWLRR